MTANASTYFKLGLFAILGGLTVVAVAFGLGLRRIRSDTATYHTYFDESVQGLDVGAPVRYRGVPIGTVKAITVAVDRRHVDVALSVQQKEARRIDLSKHPELRAQLATQGITGVKLVNLDLFDPKTHPVPRLGFDPDGNYIPSTPSLIKGLEEELSAAIERIPGVLDVATSALERIDTLAGDIQRERIPARAGTAFDRVDAAAAELQAVVRQIDRGKIPGKMSKAIDDLDRAIARADAMIESIGGEGGLVSSTQRAADSIGALGRTTERSAQDLDQTLRHLDDAMQAVRNLAHLIERDPDVLLKGHAREMIK